MGELSDSDIDGFPASRVRVPISNWKLTAISVAGDSEIAAKASGDARIRVMKT